MSKPDRYRRSGMSMLELIVGAAMLTALLTTTAQALVQVKLHQRRMDERGSALGILENSLEEITARPWDEIDEDAIKALELTDAVRRRWPRAKLIATVSTTAEPAPGKRVTLNLTLGSVDRERPITLTTWIFRAPQ